MCYDEHKSYQGSFQQGKEQTPWKKKGGITKDVSCTLERANEQTENTYINMWTHLETQNMCMLGDWHPQTRHQRENGKSPHFVKWNSRYDVIWKMVLTARGRKWRFANCTPNRTHGGQIQIQGCWVPDCWRDRKRELPDPTANRRHGSGEIWH